MKKIIYITLIVFVLFVSISVLFFFLYFFLDKKEKEELKEEPLHTSPFRVELKIHDRHPKSLIILNNGTVTFKQFNWGKMVEEETNEIKISSQEIESLKQYILDNNFFSLKEEYESVVFDCPEYIITVTIGDKTHTVYCNGNCPKEFNNIIKEFYNIIEKIESL